MRSINWLLLSGLAVIGLAMGSNAKAGDHNHTHHLECIHHHHSELPPLPRTACDAGHPFWISKHAVFTDETHHHGYMVGGGARRGGSGPCPDEGTFGWDYRGLSNVNLGFTHGRRYQMGGGTYMQDTAKPVTTFLRSLHD